jgi:carbamoyl-phosphate synthase small subunit
MVVREYCDEPSHWRSQGTFGDYLEQHGIPALQQVDTRALTRHIRSRGAMRALLLTDRTRYSDVELSERAHSAWTPNEEDVLPTVTVEQSREIDGTSELHFVLIDCGVKENILRSLNRRGIHVTVVPYGTSAAEIEELEPDAVLTSPGPGDPANADVGVETIRALLDQQLPYMGICLGHQLLSRAIGASTRKLKFGHRGGNHPVKDLASGVVHITSQNHGFEVDADTLPVAEGWRVSQVNLNDGSVEGLEHATLPVFSVQYHPEGSPGPQDNQYLFDRFIELVRQHRDGREEQRASLTDATRRRERR